MRGIPNRLMTVASVLLVGFAGMALATQNKDTVAVPGGLALSECKGYDDWAAVSVSRPADPDVINLIVANPTMIEAYRAGIPGNGKPFPDGSKIVKILSKPKQHPESPFTVAVPDTLAGVGCMVKDSKRFLDTGGWGYAQFDYDATSDTFVPNTSLQGNDATCGASCHSLAAHDNVFTGYAKR